MKRGPPARLDAPLTVDVKRRALMKASGALAAAALLPGRAHAAPPAKLHVLSEQHARTLDAFANVLVSGASNAGIAAYVDSQLNADAFHSTLLLRYLDWPGPHAAFYAAGLEALDRLAQRRSAGSFAALSAKDADAAVKQLSSGSVPEWSGPPAGLFYFVVRSDAIDVVYGTPAGFELLGLPYFPHIAPSRAWPG
jgi:hypothetical protein